MHLSDLAWSSMIFMVIVLAALLYRFNSAGDASDYEDGLPPIYVPV